MKINCCCCTFLLNFPSVLGPAHICFYPVLDVACALLLNTIHEISQVNMYNVVHGRTPAVSEVYFGWAPSF